ncbi:hypothetical protein ACLB1G_07150 [Oxalobacteraceae bacterium A2-2]
MNTLTSAILSATLLALAASGGAAAQSVSTKNMVGQNTADHKKPDPQQDQRKLKTKRKTGAAKASTPRTAEQRKQADAAHQAPDPATMHGQPPKPVEGKAFNQ